MIKPGVTDSAAVQRRIDRYLKEVDEAIKSRGAAWRDRNSIRENIQTQIREMLDARVGANATVDDAEAVIAGLDDPASYAAELPQKKASIHTNDLRPLYLVLQLAFMIGAFIVIGKSLGFMTSNAGKTASASMKVFSLAFGFGFAALLFWLMGVCGKAAAPAQREKPRYLVLSYILFLICAVGVIGLLLPIIQDGNVHEMISIQFLTRGILLTGCTYFLARILRKAANGN